jgi:hypothetical protein
MTHGVMKDSGGLVAERASRVLKHDVFVSIRLQRRRDRPCKADNFPKQRAGAAGD